MEYPVPCPNGVCDWCDKPNADAFIAPDPFIDEVGEEIGGPQRITIWCPDCYASRKQEV